LLRRTLARGGQLWHEALGGFRNEIRGRLGRLKPLQRLLRDLLLGLPVQPILLQPVGFVGREGRRLLRSLLEAVGDVAYPSLIRLGELRLQAQIRRLARAGFLGDEAGRGFWLWLRFWRGLRADGLLVGLTGAFVPVRCSCEPSARAEVASCRAEKPKP
jgi:hypothetical protein